MGGLWLVVGVRSLREMRLYAFWVGGTAPGELPAAPGTADPACGAQHRAVAAGAPREAGSGSGQRAGSQPAFHRELPLHPSSRDRDSVPIMDLGLILQKDRSSALLRKLAVA